MANFVYSASSGLNDPMFGKYITPIKMLIENESNQWEKNRTSLKTLYNIEKSKNFAESVMGESDFNTFQAVEEGQGAENDSVQKTFDKTIYHVEFMKEFYITKKMADDSKIGWGTSVKSKVEGFTRAYYKTQIKLGAEALIQATNPHMMFNKAKVDLTTGDQLPLFHSAHTYFKPEFKKKTQSNYYYGSLTSSADALEEALAIGANNLRNVEDENGEAMGYTGDVIVIPCNRPKMEMMFKRVIGSERTAGSDFNDINTQYGNWTLVVLDGWRTTDDRYMIMSSEANKYLHGNLFFNRMPLNIVSGVDDHTRNMYWNGYCRFGVGFSTWKHIALYVNSADAVNGATALA